MKHPLSGLPPADLLERLATLLEQERRAEVETQRAETRDVPLAQQEASGRLARHLHVTGRAMGSGGLLALTLARADGARLPRLTFGPGDPVGLGGPAALLDPARPGEVTGVVGAVGGKSLTVLLDPRAEDDLPDEKLAVWPQGSPVTHERSLAALSRARDAKGRSARLRDVLLGAHAPGTPLPGGSAPAGLNDAQASAVVMALGAPDVALIHGPPGTGKTATAAALCAAAVALGHRVLLVAASNTGADELTRACLKRGVDVLRVGHPARVDVALHDCLLQEKVAAHPRAQLARDLVRQAENLRNRSGDSRKSAGAARAEREARKAEWRGMVADARLYTRQAEEEVLRRARVVAATLAVVGGPQLAGETFDLAILDEASQATIPLSLMVLPVVERIMLVGDHKQLPPTVVSPVAARGGLETTLFDRLHASGAPSTLLTVQHRMHQDIMAYANTRHYGGALVAHPSVATRTLADVLGPGAAVHAELEAPFAFVDTSGAGMTDELPEGSLSHRNNGEAALCAALVRQILATGLAPGRVGLIVPYRAQVTLLSDLLDAEIQAGLEVDSVDAFQGREKEAVVVGLTRSNDAGEMGFVADARRLNVALTRARVLMRVVGDAATVGARGEGAALVEHAAAQGTHVSVWGLSVFDGA